MSNMFGASEKSTRTCQPRTLVSALEAEALKSATTGPSAIGPLFKRWWRRTRRLGRLSRDCMVTSAGMDSKSARRLERGVHCCRAACSSATGTTRLTDHKSKRTVEPTLKCSHAATIVNTVYEPLFSTADLGEGRCLVPHVAGTRWARGNGW